MKNSRIKALILTLTLILTQMALAEDPEADQIIRKAIEAYGGNKFDHCDIEFVFRDRTYKIYRDKGIFEYKRITKDNGSLITDIVSNDGFKRLIDGEESYLAQIMAGKYASSVNSVIYFAMLPFRLSDEAVISKYLGEIKIKGKSYYKIEVRFSEDSGGEDFEDVFIYWFEKGTYNMDYFGYSYLESTPGLRFRKAYNKRTVNGLVFQDYENYKANPLIHELENLDSLFENGKLELLSKIELENIQVK